MGGLEKSAILRLMTWRYVSSLNEYQDLPGFHSHGLGDIFVDDVEAEAEGESGFGKGMFGVGEIVFCEVAWYQNTFPEFHD